MPMPTFIRHIKEENGNRPISLFPFYAGNKGITRGKDMNFLKRGVAAVIRMPAAEVLADWTEYLTFCYVTFHTCPLDQVIGGRANAAAYDNQDRFIF